MFVPNQLYVRNCMRKAYFIYLSMKTKSAMLLTVALTWATIWPNNNNDIIIGWRVIRAKSCCVCVCGVASELARVELPVFSRYRQFCVLLPLFVCKVHSCTNHCSPDVVTNCAVCFSVRHYSTYSGELVAKLLVILCIRLLAVLCWILSRECVIVNLREGMWRGRITDYSCVICLLRVDSRTDALNSIRRRCCVAFYLCTKYMWHVSSCANNYNWIWWIESSFVWFWYFAALLRER